jgi:hypothetical protein
MGDVDIRTRIGRIRKRSPVFKRRFFDSITQLCTDKEGTIDWGYIMSKWKVATHVGYAWRWKDSRKQDKELYGVSLSKLNKNKKQMELFLLCSNKRFGGKVLERTENYAKANGMESVFLHAVDDKESYYQKKGYSYNRNACLVNKRQYRYVDKMEGAVMSKCLYTQSALAQHRKQQRKKTADAKRQTKDQLEKKQQLI